MKPVFWGVISTAVVASFMAWGWFAYKDYLTRGMRPTESTLKLNEIEKSGVPLFEMQDISGKTYRLADYKEKIVIINFWASWCAPCVKEFPSMIRLLEKFPEDIILFAVSHDKNEEDLSSFLRAFDVQKVPNFVVIWDKSMKLAEKYGTTALPESYILKKGLELERKVAGVEEWDQPMAVRFFEGMIDGTLHQPKPAADQESSSKIENSEGSSEVIPSESETASEKNIETSN